VSEDLLIRLLDLRALPVKKRERVSAQGLRARVGQGDLEHRSARSERSVGPTHVERVLRDYYAGKMGDADLNAATDALDATGAHIHACRSCNRAC
jgi:hypothetical protein